MIRYAIACALLVAPTGALAQAGAGPAPVTVEIVVSGEVTVPAQRFRGSITVTAKDESEETAKAKLAAEKAALMQALAAINVRDHAVTLAGGQFPDGADRWVERAFQEVRALGDGHR